MCVVAADSLHISFEGMLIIASHIKCICSKATPLLPRTTVSKKALIPLHVSTTIKQQMNRPHAQAYQGPGLRHTRNSSMPRQSISDAWDTRLGWPCNQPQRKRVVKRQSALKTRKTKSPSHLTGTIFRKPYPTRVSDLPLTFTISDGHLRTLEKSSDGSITSG